MTLQDALTKVFEQARSMRALAVLGAELRLRTENGEADQRVRSLLQEVARAADPSLLDDLSVQEQAAVLGVIRLSFRDANDLLENPGRPPGWAYTDPEALESQGRASRANIASINGAAAQRPDLAAALQSGTFLDVGTGVGQMAIAAAQTWPRMQVVGIDIWEPALARARANVAATGLARRIELRNQSVADLSDDQCYTLAWLPAPFIPEELFEPAIARMHDALKPGGYLVVGQYAIPDDPLSGALSRLLIVRSGGYPWRTTEIAGFLRSAGFSEVESLQSPPAGDFVIGRRGAN